jgi:urease accessory protein
VPLEARADHLQIEPDPVLADMLRGIHLIVREMQAPFEPEGGAYESQSQHHHDHAHAHEHGHGHHHHDRG